MHDDRPPGPGAFAPCAQLMLHRRRFLRAGGAALAAIPLATACDFAELRGDTTIPAGLDFDLSDDSLAALRSPGGIASLRANDNFAVVLVRDEADTIYAFNSVCPHNNLDMAMAGGAVSAAWDVEEGELRCNFHQSRFNEQGEYVGGALTPWVGEESPIERYEVDFDPATGMGRVFVQPATSADAGDGTDADPDAATPDAGTQGEGA